MRVAHFVHRYPPALGGSEAYLARLSRYLVESGDEVRVFTTNALDLEAFWSSSARTVEPGEANERGVRVRRYAIRHWPLRRYMLKAFSLLPIAPVQCATLPCNPICPEMWRDAALADGFDVVHATAFPYGFPLLCGLRLARRCRAPFLLTPFLHLGDPATRSDGTRSGYLSRAMRFLLKAAERIFVQTNIERTALLEIGIPPERLVLLGMGVDPAECTGGDRLRARQRWGLVAGDVVIGHLANKSVEKGTVDLLQAANKLWQNGARFKLLLAGPEMPNFAQFWKHEPSAQRDQNAVRLGVLSDDDKRDFFAAIDAFAMPSRSDSFGIVFLEAWANGVPCVAYRAGGVAEVIRHDVDGLLAGVGDVAELANHLKRLVENSDLRAAMGRAGQERTLRDFLWPARLARVREVYAEALAENTSQSLGLGGRG